MNKQETIQRIIDQEIYTNASQFVTELTQDPEGRYIDDITPCLERVDYSEPPEGYSAEETIDGEWMVLCGGIQTGDNVDLSGAGDDTYETEGQAIKAAWEDYGDEPEERLEALQHWLVSDWLADKLESIGACVVHDIMGFDIWGRTECGQSLMMDSDLNKVAELIGYKEGGDNE